MIMRLWKNVLYITLVFSMSANQYPLYFCTGASSEYFRALLNLIGSIHKSHLNDLGEIAVFDLGLKNEQLKILSQIQSVRICQLELKNPGILKPIDKQGSLFLPKTGAYSFKPVAIKQALELYPYFLWIDAGSTIFGSIRILFDHIREQGYFLHNSADFSDWPLHKQLCSYPAHTLKLHEPDRQWILGKNVPCVESGVMGFTNSVLESLVLPVYEMAGDLKNFIDDGSSSGGLGTGRHDQAVIAAQAYISGLFIHQHLDRYANKLHKYRNKKTKSRKNKIQSQNTLQPYISNPIGLSIGNQKVDFHITNYFSDPFERSFQGIMCSRLQLIWFDHFYKYIQWNNSNDPLN